MSPAASTVFSLFSIFPVDNIWNSRFVENFCEMKKWNKVNNANSGHPTPFLGQGHPKKGKDWVKNVSEMNFLVANHIKYAFGQILKCRYKSKLKLLLSKLLSALSSDLNLVIRSNQISLNLDCVAQIRSGSHLPPSPHTDAHTQTKPPSSFWGASDDRYEDQYDQAVS